MDEHFESPVNEPGAFLLGLSMVRAAIEGRPPPRHWDLAGCWVVRESVVMAVTGRTAPAAALAVVGVHLRDLGSHSPQSLDRLVSDMSLFVARLELIGVSELRQVTRLQVLDFIDEPFRVDRYMFRDPSLGTRHFRRAAVRLFFKTARALGLCEHDPTMDIELARRSEGHARPLTDDEVAAGETAALWTLDLTRLPAAWALGEATAVSAEIANAQVGDVDLDNRRVWLRGPAKRTPRWGPLTDWGVEALRRRVADLNTDDPKTGLVYGGTATGKSGASAVCGAIHEVMVLAGLQREAGVRPLSLSAWAGRREFERSGRIDNVARVLGLRTLDRAARMIQWDWQS